MTALKKTFCLNYDIKIAVLNERCAGFGQAMSELGIEYLGQIEVPRDNTTLYVSVVETAVGEFSDWEGYFPPGWTFAAACRSGAKEAPCKFCHGCI